MADCKFTGTTEQWRSLFSHATINFNIKQILVEVNKNKSKPHIFTSATTEGIKHTWACIKALAFDISKGGQFVINTDDIKGILKIMKPLKDYTGTVDGNKLTIEGEKEKLTVTLASLEKHTNDDSSYVDINPKGDRYMAPLKHKNGLPIPIEPPLDGEPSNSEWKQLLQIEAGTLKSKLKDAKTISSNTMKFSTLKKSKGELVIILADDDEDVVSAEMLDVKGGMKYDWKYSFATENLEPIISMCNNDVYLSMTDRDSPAGKNPGLWIATTQGDPAEIVAGYLVNSLKVKE